MKSETSFRVFFLKQYRKNSLKNIFSHQKVYLWISAFDHRAIVVPKMHIVQWPRQSAPCKGGRLRQLDNDNLVGQITRGKMISARVVVVAIFEKVLCSKDPHQQLRRCE